MSHRPRSLWHVTNWGPLGWLETGVKVLGMGACVAAFATSAGPLSLRPDVRSLAALVLTGLTVMTAAALFLRFQAREVIAFGFAVGNVLSHVAGLVSLPRASPAVGWLTLFGTCFVTGELIKQYFLRSTGYCEQGRSHEASVRPAGRIMGAYAVFTLLMLLAR